MAPTTIAAAAAAIASVFGRRILNWENS
jgi:hypothetical protein